MVFWPEVREFIKDTRPKTNTRHGVGGRRTALLLRLGLYTPPSSRTASSGRFVGGRRRRRPGFSNFASRAQNGAPDKVRQSAVLGARPREHSTFAAWRNRHIVTRRCQRLSSQAVTRAATPLICLRFRPGWQRSTGVRTNPSLLSSTLSVSFGALAALHQTRHTNASLCVQDVALAPHESP